jgi:hypothetical protein
MDWEETKRYLAQFSIDGKKYINEAMSKESENVKYRSEGNTKFWEWGFIHNGYNCFLQYQTGGKNDIYRVIGFNGKDNSCYIREPLNEGLLDSL